MTEGRWELIENYGPGEEPQVVGRYTNEQRARRAALSANLASAPVEPGDDWGPDYYVREAHS